MAGDWLKFEHATPRKPEVLQIARSLSVSRHEAVGILAEAWIWADQHGEADGNEQVNVRGVTEKDLDDAIGVTGLAAAMMSAGWLSANGSGLTFTNGGRHIGETAKQRALGAKRVAACKAKKKRKSNDATVTTALPREEKRREEETTTPYSPPSDLLEDPPLGIGGAGPPPDRKRPVHTISVEVIEKIRALIAEWEKAGGRFVQHPTKDDEALGGQIIEKMLKPGCRVEDIMGATQADMKAAEQIYLTYRMADLTKSVTSRGKHLTLGHLKAALLAKRERAWEAKKREEKREAEVNTAAAGLLTLKTLPAEAEIWRQWRGLPLTDRQTRIAKWHNEEAAMKEWQEQKG